MNQWFDRLRFLWEEEISPPEEAPRMHRGEPTGVPRPLRRATRFALMAVLATNLLGQIVGVRLVAPVDAATTYVAECVKACNDAQTNCLAGCTGKKSEDCKATCNDKLESCIEKAQDTCKKDKGDKDDKGDEGDKGDKGD